jgi:threonine dehydrogenase-like Zn-dependent dehydrogenase
MFDDAALDVNIKGMEEERMAYPLAYGYSLVGRVVQCGSEVPDADALIGKLVFTFSAHATHVITDRDAIQIVPEGIEAKDAIFMPSVETALSIVHDAHVRLGEKVAVFGQGLIGLLVTAILCISSNKEMDLQAPSCGSLGNKLGTVTTIDAIPSRLAMSAAMGSSQALLPPQVQASGPFDVTIEVSGNARALQSAIDNTSNHGRLVVASWYGNADVALKLGIEFHRSHKTIVTSQVSEIKAELSGLWTKQRRFGLTWELVRQILES